MSAFKDLRKLLNEALDVVEAEVEKAGNGPLTTEAVPCRFDLVDTEVPSPRLFSARRAAIGAAQQIIASIQTAADRLTTDSCATLQTATLSALSRSGVFNILAADGIDRKEGLPWTEIRDKMDESKRFADKNLPRYLRFACALDWLVETSPDFFALTRFSLVLATNPAARCYFESLSLQNSRATAAFYDNATDPKTRESESAAETAWSQGMGDVLKPGQGVWDYFGQNDAEMAQFAHGMAFGIATTAAVIADYPWDTIEGTIVDVGGGNGSLSLPVLRKCKPDVKLIIQDRPEVVELAKANLSQNWQEIEGRVLCRGHNFFEPNPEHGKGVHYMLRGITHDWSDTETIKILTNLSSVMDQDSKVLIVDTVIQPGRGENTLDGFLADLRKADETNYKLLEPPAPLNKAWSDCKTQRSLDILMGAWFQAKERTQDQMIAVADAAGLKFHKVYPTRACHWVSEFHKK